MERIRVARSWALTWTPFFGSLLMKMEIVLTFVLYHEVLHVALCVFSRGERFTDMVLLGGRLVSLWNVAHDYVVNDIIKQMVPENDAQMPSGGLWSPKYRNWACEDIYADLREEAAKNPAPSNPVPGDGDGDGDDGNPGSNRESHSGMGQLPAPDGEPWGVGDLREDLGGGDDDSSGGRRWWKPRSARTSRGRREGWQGRC
jgi:hypothetical protein